MLPNPTTANFTYNVCGNPINLGKNLFRSFVVFDFSNLKFFELRVANFLAVCMAHSSLSVGNVIFRRVLSQVVRINASLIVAAMASLKTLFNWSSKFMLKSSSMGEYVLSIPPYLNISDSSRRLCHDNAARSVIQGNGLVFHSFYVTCSRCSHKEKIHHTPSQVNGMGPRS